MNRRVILFIHTVVLLLLQAIPNTIAIHYYTVYGIGTYMESFFHIADLWGAGLLWYPVITVCSVLGCAFALLYLLRGRAWMRFTVLGLSAMTLLCLGIPIWEMFLSAKNFSALMILIAVLSIADIVLCAIPERKKAV